MSEEIKEMPPQDATDKEASGGRRPSACSPFVVLNLRKLKPIPCADRDAVQDTIRALRTNGARYVALQWWPSGETYIQLEAHE